MIKTIQQEIKVCDFCDSDESVFHECRNCGKHDCFDCLDENFVTYSHAVHSTGSGDGDCLAEGRSAGLSEHPGLAVISFACPAP